MDPKTARFIAILLAVLAAALAVLATVVRYSKGKPTDFGALIGAAMCLFFIIIIVGKRGDRR
ncbi:MAG: hypothetical protein ACJ8I9_04825 [Chthoniobacterales bacterium]|jgi:hypothetical protein